MISDDAGMGSNPPLNTAADLHPQVARLQAACEQAERRARAQSDLLANVCHEIRTSLGAITSLAALLAERDLDPEPRVYAETIGETADMLLDILNDVLDHARLEHGRLRIAMQDVSLDDFLAPIRTCLEARAVDKGIDCSVDVDPAVPERFRADPLRLRQVLTNFIDNAVKFTDAGRVTVRVTAAGEGDDARLRFSVTDTGIGLSEADRKRLFSPYEQADEQRRGHRRGTGLGLAISAKLVELMQGTIGCDSTDEAGSTFWFEVPLVTVAATESPRDAASCRSAPSPVADTGAAANAATPGVTPLVTSRGHILVVEDNRVNQLLVGTYLRQLGYTYEFAASGSEAIEAIRESAFDLVLMDIHMPDMDGLETTRALRAMGGASACLPIVALTANAVLDRQKVCGEGAMDDLLTKPIDAARLQSVISRHLAPRTASPSPASGARPQATARSA